MARENAAKSSVASLREAIEKRDQLGFSRGCFKVANFCRRALFQGDRQALTRWYSELSSLLIWFYRNGKAEWPEAERSMGGLEMLLSLMGNFIESRTLQEVLAEVRRSAVDTEILLELFRNPDGIRSGDLAKHLGKSHNSITNRLPGLEKRGLLVRSRLGKNSVVYITPKGRGVSEDLRKIKIPEVAAKRESVDIAGASLGRDVCGRELGPGEIPSFWNLGPRNVPTHGAHEVEIPNHPY